MATPQMRYEDINPPEKKVKPKKVAKKAITKTTKKTEK
jgi:hypothetical protein